ncbi:UpxY family transcription antiterminator [Aquimarina addita]|uniref:UpxY family transcription antiterminator n=1 Tax=Aquimarina addita TaxID=870485 RepID=A0ABP7XH55_9FLAO
MKNGTGWHVIYVKYKHEVKVQEELERLGLEVFLPMTYEIRQWSDRKKKVTTPLFPSYIFVNITSTLDFHKALSVDSACSFIRFGNEYGRVSQNEIDQIKLLVGAKDITEVKTNIELPSIGDTLKIEHGELSGLECEVYRIDNSRKISVRVNSLRQNISATIPAHYLQKSDANLMYH